jgi:hypothetical protein
MAPAPKIAEVHFSKKPSGRVELLVPRGTKLKDVLKAQEVLSRELFPKLSPRGCLPCISGVPFLIREKLDNVIKVDLRAGEIVK